MRKSLFLLLLLVSLSNTYAQKFEGLAMTPQMGWNSWNKFNCDINENLIKEIADNMVMSGLRDAGYIYVNLDDGWQGERDSLGFLHPDPKKFPSGMKALADYVHSKGLKIGIYADAGRTTCAGYPGSLGHEYQDALQFAKWGIDYLKYDWCETQDINPKGAYRLIRDAIRTAGRPILLSICEWGLHKPWEWGSDIGHSWRTTGDIYNCFDCPRDNNFNAWTVTEIIDKQVEFNTRRYAGPDHWNDPDMLEVGNGMPVNQERAHFSLWCMLAAPLILGNDISNMSTETASILLNKEVIAINQDKKGVQALRHTKTDDGLEIWFKPLADDGWAMCLFNNNLQDAKFEIDWSQYNIEDEVSGCSTRFSDTVYKIRNLWSKSEDGNTKRSRKVVVPAQDVILYKLTPLSKK